MCLKWAGKQNVIQNLSRFVPLVGGQVLGPPPHPHGIDFPPLGAFVEHICFLGDLKWVARLGLK